MTGLEFTVAAFTNLSHEHLDYHGSMEEYFVVKSRLFTSEHSQRAVIWVDDQYGERLAESTTLPATMVSRRDATEVETTLKGTTFFWRGHLVNSALLGDYNVDNSLIAMTIMSALGAEDAAIAAAMGDVTAVAGRFDVVRDSNVTVIVDYAHTPEGTAPSLGRRARDVSGWTHYHGLRLRRRPRPRQAARDGPRRLDPLGRDDRDVGQPALGSTRVHHRRRSCRASSAATNVVRDADRRSAIARALDLAAPR